MSDTTSRDMATVYNAIERLEIRLERLAERYQSVRQERDELREKFEKAKHERIDFDATTAARLESAAQERRRMLELEEQLNTLRGREAQLQDAVADAERRVGERESMIADQEDTISQLRSRIDKQHLAVEEQIEGLRTRATTLRQELDEARGELERERSESTVHRQELEQLREQHANGSGPSLPEGAVVIDAGERDRMVAQISHAIEVIDRYLGGKDEV